MWLVRSLWMQLVWNQAQVTPTEVSLVFLHLPFIFLHYGIVYLLNLFFYLAEYCIAMQGPCHLQRGGNERWTMSRWARWLPSCSLFFDTTNTGQQTNHMDNDKWMMRLTNSDDGWKQCGTLSRWWQYWASSLHALWAPKFPPLSVYHHSCLSHGIKLRRGNRWQPLVPPPLLRLLIVTGVVSLSSFSVSSSFVLRPVL